MKNLRPSLLTNRVLEHLLSRSANEALSGDLLEELENGRGTTWYVRQVLSALVQAALRNLRTRWILLALATMLTGLAQSSWWFHALWPVVEAPRFVRPWPGDMSISISTSVLLSLWVGIFLYGGFCFLVKRTLRIKRLERALWLGPVTFILCGVLIQGVSFVFEFSSRSFDLAKLISFCLSLLIAAWDISPATNGAHI